MPPFYKYTALGNDMIVIDPAQWTQPLTPPMVRQLCHRHFGIGADGICYGPLPGSDGLAMRFFNPDGSEAEKSGNGLRIMARYLWDHGYAPSNPFAIRIAGETVIAEVLDDTAVTIALHMGRVTVQPPQTLLIGSETLPIIPASMGNPHCVHFTNQPGEVRRLGHAIATHPHFVGGTNVQFVHIIDRHTIQIEIWERGAGYTLASGTSACAAAGTAVAHHHCQSPVTVHMAGGSATVTIDDSGQTVLTGSVYPLFSGILAADFFQAASG